MARPLLLAIAVCAAIGIVVMAFVYLATGQIDVASWVAGLPLLVVPTAKEFFERRASERAGQGAAVRKYTFDEFQIGWRLMALYALVGVAVIFWGVAIAGNVVASSLLPPTTAPNLIYGPVRGVVTLILSLSTLYFFSRWVGVRSRRFGLAILIIALAAVVVSAKVIDYAVLEDDSFKLVYGGNIKSSEFFIESTVIGSIPMILSVIVGYCRGVMLKDVEYTRKVLSMLPVATRSVLKDLIREEAARLASAR